MSSPIFCPDVLGDLFLRDSHLVRCRSGTEIEYVSFKVLAEPDLRCLTVRLTSIGNPLIIEGAYFLAPAHGVNTDNSLWHP
jgi:hypothetical protein